MRPGSRAMTLNGKAAPGARFFAFFFYNKSIPTCILSFYLSTGKQVVFRSKLLQTDASGIEVNSTDLKKSARRGVLSGRFSTPWFNCASRISGTLLLLAIFFRHGIFPRLLFPCFYCWWFREFQQVANNRRNLTITCRKQLLFPHVLPH